MPKNKKNTAAERRKIIAVYLPPGILKSLDDEAQGESRSRSQMVLVLITEALKSRRELQLA